MKKILAFSERYLVAIALLIWVLELVFYAFTLGVKEGSDTYLFLTFAQRSSFGDPYVDRHYLWYTSYTLFLSFIFKYGIGLTSAVCLQVALATSTLWVIYDLTQRLCSSSAAKWSILLYVVWFDSHIWHFYIYTDSLFTSCSLWCLWLFCTCRTFKMLLFIFPFVVFTAFIRPTGIVLLEVYFLALVLSLQIPKWSKWAIGGVFVSLLIVLAQNMLPTFEVIDSYRIGEVVFSYPAWNVPPCSEVVFPLGVNSLSNIGWFALHNPAYFFLLSFCKIGAYLVHAKPFYSLSHNVYILVFLLPAYGFFMVGLKRWKEKVPKWLLLFWMLGHLFLVALTTEDGDGRFLLPIVPIVLVGTAIGWESLVGKYYQKMVKHH